MQQSLPCMSQLANVQTGIKHSVSMRSLLNGEENTEV